MNQDMDQSMDEAFGPLMFPHLLKETTKSIHDFNGSEEVCCLFCCNLFVFPVGRKNYSTHLLMEHRFLITETQNITSMKMYCDYWRSRFETVPPQEICRKMLSDTKIEGCRVQCLVLGDFVSEDRIIREELKNKRLHWALEQQAREREDSNFTRGCLLCRMKIRGTRAEYLTHLSLMHNMQLGKPDNLVFIDSLLQTIEDKLNSLKCLFCNKVFKDRNVLKEHMRKKMHKKINPEHREFDNYYIINYAELGKDWLDMKKETDEEGSPSAENFEGMSDCEWFDWDDFELEEVVCLFCKTCSSFEEILNHMQSSHNFSFTEICVQHCLSFYQQIKLVNYIRKQVYRGQCPACNVLSVPPDTLLEHMTVAGHFILPEQKLWEQPEHYFPTYENDPFLCHLDDQQDEVSELQLSHQMNLACKVVNEMDQN